MSSLTVRALERSYDDEVLALRDVSFEVEDGRVAAILGPSGCGKTTVLRLIAGLDQPDAGDVLLDGESILEQPAHRRGVGLMFQELALFPHLDVAHNIEFGLRMLDWPREEREFRIAELLRLVGLVEMGRRRTHELSGGERQRVALARTLAPQPSVLLLDEPLGALDEQRKEELRVHLRDLLHRLRVTALLVSHDLRDAVAIADDLLVMESGRLLQAGPVADVLRQPACASVARLVGYVTLLDGTLEDGAIREDGVGAVSPPADQEVAGHVLVLAHPSALLAVPAARGLGIGVTGVVAATRPDGPSALVEVSLGDRRRVPARWEWDMEPPQPGTRVELAVRPQTLRFFPASAPSEGQASDLQATADSGPASSVEDSARAATPAGTPPDAAVPVTNAVGPRASAQPAAEDPPHPDVPS